MDHTYELFIIIFRHALLNWPCLQKRGRLRTMQGIVGRAGTLEPADGALSSLSVSQRHGSRDAATGRHRRRQERSKCQKGPRPLFRKKLEVK